MCESISALLKKTTASLKVSGYDRCEREAETILESVLKISRSELHLNRNRSISKNNLLQIEEILKKRVLGIPLQYAIGSTYFYSSDFIVSEDVLIPRPDTETLIEAVLKNESGKDAFFADIGTGSGAIASTLVHEGKNFKAIAIDISEKAAKIAKKNFSNQPISTVLSNSLSALKQSNQFDFIVSNPPYISPKEMESIDQSVSKYEPHTALVAEDEGLYFYKLFATEFLNYIKRDGFIYCEIGFRQGKAVKEMFNKKGWRDIKIIKDLGDRDRVIIAKAPASEKIDE